MAPRRRHRRSRQARRARHERAGGGRRPRRVHRRVRARARRARRGMAITRRWRIRQQRDRRGLDRPLRHARTAGAVAAASDGRFRAWRVRAHRGRQRQRCRVSARIRAARRRRLGPERPQAVHHERALRAARGHVRARWRGRGGQAHAGITAFIVPTDAPGVSLGPSDQKMGLHASDTSSLVLEDARVGADAVLGEIGKGFSIALAGLDGGRIGIAAQSIGISRAVVERAIAYGRERRQFGKPIVDSRRSASRWPARAPISTPRVCSTCEPPGYATRVARSHARRRWPSSSRARPRSA